MRKNIINIIISWGYFKMQKQCIICQRIIIEDWERWLTNNRYTNEIQCPYCGYIEKLGWEEE